MNLFDILRLECIAAGVELKDKSDALNEVVRVAKKSSVFTGVSEEELLMGIEEREKTGTTGFGKGIAIPHCRLTDITEFVVGVITVPQGVDFDALDGEKVHLIIFIIGPDYESNEHIRILSIVSRILHIPGVVDEILAEKTPESIHESLLRYSLDQVDTKDRKEKQLCHVFVQDAELFEDILQVFAAMETCSVTVIEGKNTREYLLSMPLFAGFWGDSHLGFNRIITAVIDKSLINETLRSIESITGQLDQRTDILVIVQNLFYAAGSLEP
jgi:mannitol/fructose-specific phosphotransferase system IIA component (Ntr-type)